MTPTADYSAVSETEVAPGSSSVPSSWDALCHRATGGRCWEGDVAGSPSGRGEGREASQEEEVAFETRYGKSTGLAGCAAVLVRKAQESG